MKFAQIVGPLLIISAFLAAIALIAGLEPRATASSAAAAGLGLFFGIGPLFCLGSVILLPTSLALLSRKLREKFGVVGFWLMLWKLNLVLSAVVVFCAVWFTRLYWAGV